MGASEMETKETLNREIRVQCVVLMHGRVLKSSGNANVWLSAAKHRTLMHWLLHNSKISLELYLYRRHKTAQNSSLGQYPTKSKQSSKYINTSTKMIGGSGMSVYIAHPIRFLLPYRPTDFAETPPCS